MIKGLYLATSGMIPRMTQMYNVANNISNVSTNGYKKQSVFLRQLIEADYALDHALGMERSVVPEDIWTDFTQGSLERTNNTFDFALNGSGFFRVRDAEGNIFYTRNGSFHLDQNGMLITNAGMYLLNTANNPVQIDGDEVRIMSNGDIFVDDDDNGSIGISEFDQNDYQSLQEIGMGLFVKPAAINEIAPYSGTQCIQGYLESANVESVNAMIDMIQILREFEMGQKVIQIQDQTLQRVVTEVGVLG